MEHPSSQILPDALTSRCHRMAVRHVASFRYSAAGYEVSVCTWLKIVLLPVLVLGWCCDARSDEPWIHHSRFTDFASGTLEDGGSNLYITREGSLQMIHRWDFNNDGYLDLWVGQDHDVVEDADVLVYWGSEKGPRSLFPPLREHQPLVRLMRQFHSREKKVTKLPSDGGGRSVLVDLNNDGYSEIVFCNFIHNYSVHMRALVYWGSPDGYASERRDELPTLMAGGVAAADFNQDGFVDLAFANRGIEGGERFGFDKHLESYVYWNGPTGFSSDRRSSLPTVSATDCAAADINGDGYPELLFANNNSKHQSVSMYWGRSEGFSKQHREVWSGGDPVGLHLTELDGDAITDLVVLHGDDYAELWRGTGASLERWGRLATSGATECEVSDLNQDGHSDLIFANAGSDEEQLSYIYWGADGGYSGQARTDLPTLHATDVCVADFNSDGWTDVVFANEHSESTYDVNSFLYWNGPDGFDDFCREELQGFGAVSNVAEDLDGDGHVDLVLINRHSGSYKHSDSFVYWGNPRHHYSQAAMTELPGRSDASTIADLNDDGFVDIVFPSGWVYWGTAQGFSADRRQRICQIEGRGVTVADLNRDGDLDLIFVAGEVDEGEGVILWGDVDGYESSNRTTLPLSTRLSLSTRVADFNKDGFLDIVFGDVDSTAVDIFWGTDSGHYSGDFRTKFKFNNGASVEIADLNSDGWLDLIMGGGWDDSRFGRPTRQAHIVWGAPSGFSSDRVLKLEAYDSLEQSVADLNRDGYLDLIMTNYHAYTTRTIPVFIYWGDKSGRFSESRRSTLPAESSAPVTVADLNQDNWLDIVAFNHIRTGDHGVGANIYWGSPTGFSGSNHHWLQTFGPHFGVGRDVGNIYDRKLEERFVSAPLKCPPGQTPAHLTWQARTPHGTEVRFQIRTAARRDGLADAPWQGTTGSDSWYDTSNTDLNPARNTRWVQYRVALHTPDGGSTPVLEEVRISVK
ncbi:MAG: VCBS repeat-containing protein [Fuerstiella sp.]|nr:VCBS repeat-containing protein [Fuerstiella sp.]